jgi:hypothetical protein
MTERETAPSALITYNGVPVRHVFGPATPAHIVRSLQATAEAQAAHRVRSRAVSAMTHDLKP